MRRVVVEGVARSAPPLRQCGALGTRHHGTPALESDFERKLTSIQRGGIRDLTREPLLTTGNSTVPTLDTAAPQGARGLKGALPARNHGVRVGEHDALGQALLMHGLGVMPEFVESTSRERAVVPIADMNHPTMLETLQKVTARLTKTSQARSLGQSSLAGFYTIFREVSQSVESRSSGDGDNSCEYLVSTKSKAMRGAAPLFRDADVSAEAVARRLGELQEAGSADMTRQQVRQSARSASMQLDTYPVSDGVMSPVLEVVSKRPYVEEFDFSKESESCYKKVQLLLKRLEHRPAKQTLSPKASAPVNEPLVQFPENPKGGSRVAGPPKPDEGSKRGVVARSIKGALSRAPGK